MRKFFAVFLLLSVSSAHAQTQTPKYKPSPETEVALEIFDLSEQVRQLKAENEEIKEQLQIQNDSIARLKSEVDQLEYEPPSRY
jgi:predicted RNase H-like nuclease (RuvC/YqgF family)